MKHIGKIPPATKFDPQQYFLDALQRSTEAKARIRAEADERVNALEQLINLEREVASFLPLLESALNQLGLCITGAGVPHNKQFSLTARKLGGKFKFLTNTGRYDSRGRSTNHAARLAKAKRIADHIVNNTPPGIVGAYVNEFSLEIYRDAPPHQVADRSVMIAIQLA